MPITQILLTQNTTQGGGGGGGTAANFTIEWWQKVENNFNNARPWSVGLYSTQKLAISYESMTSDYFWINDSYVLITSQNHIGAGWRHFAYVRTNGEVKGYINGTQYTVTVDNTNLITDSTVPLYVGTGELAAGTFKGYITNLHIMKGVAKYSGNFTVPSVPTQLASGSVFLLPALDDSTKYVDTQGSKNSTLTGTVAWSSDTPFTAYSPVTVFGDPWNDVGTPVIYVHKTNFPDGANIQAGWLFVADNYTATVISATDPPGEYRLITLSITSGVMDGSSGIFSQPALGGSLYFNGSSYLNYGASVDWAMDA